MKKMPKVWSVALLMVILLGVLMTCLIFLKVQPHIPLIGCTVILVLFALMHGARWLDIEGGLVEGIHKGLKPIMILALVGVVIGVWMASGTVPYLVFIGFELINPKWFLVTALISTMIVSTFTGSSFTTIGTVGAALMGIGMGFGIDPAVCAGAVICGACFGDKMSPLSDTTNFSPAVAGVDIFTHIRHMMWTTVPAVLVTFIIFVFLGRNTAADVSMADITAAKHALESSFNLSWLVMVSPLIVVIMAFLKKPIIPVLITGIVTGAITALFMQNGMTVSSLIKTMQNGFHLKTSNDLVSNIVNRGGLQSMMSSISLIFIALGFGGIAQKVGLIDIMIQCVIKKIHRKGHYVTAAALSSIGVNIMTGEQYLSILLPGQAYQKVFDKKAIPRKTLSRTLEDGGTLVNPLIPWGVSGAFFTQALGVHVTEYLPFVFFLYLSPLFTIAMAYLPKLRNVTLNHQLEKVS
ncbi:sodium/proton antiporter (NhaC family) [Scopulibacillus darangshiensis]|uniref:Sodium/proton antiporter (NhaC family) n=1 Tax=Scopulibacillus darangshiensis TaxID=442528 RepID=A0A4R2NNY2_9BACL|nr:Na+/H+ antiporter NhaC [Scopulibacillus darangshiensis]TCP23028.1 sodium/proton antiporter (NhaC family) [Scopulibacillus darangshiensis]